MKKSFQAVTALCAIALASSAFATIQPTRVGPVSQYGALMTGKNAAGEGRIYGSVDGVVDGKEVQVRGMSLTWSQYWPYGSSFYGHSFIDTLVGSWNVELVRSAMGVVPPWGHGGYMTRPEYFESQMDTVVQAAIANDVYVLIDWHSEGGYYNCIHPNGTPVYKFNDNSTCFSAADAAAFFGRMAERYGKYPHVIFEIYNEPVSESWDDLKAYADTVLTEIRKYSSNLVVIGTPVWSSMAGDAVNNPVQDNNIAYTYHFYADLHQTSSHIASSNAAMAAGLSVFVTEWGGIDKIFSNASHKTQLESFLSWVNEKKLSTAKWDVEKPYLEDNDVDNYIKANILPAKTTYTKNVNWETSITDNLPGSVTYGTSSAIPGTWSATSDIDDYGITLEQAKRHTDELEEAFLEEAAYSDPKAKLTDRITLEEMYYADAADYRKINNIVFVYRNRTQNYYCAMYARTSNFRSDGSPELNAVLFLRNDDTASSVRQAKNDCLIMQQTATYDITKLK